MLTPLFWGGPPGGTAGEGSAEPSGEELGWWMSAQPRSLLHGGSETLFIGVGRHAHSAAVHVVLQF